MAARPEDEAHAERRRDLGARHVAVERAVAGVAPGAQDVEGEGDVLGGDRRPVMEAGRGVDVERDPAAVGGQLHGFGDQPVEGVGLVEGARHQRVEEQLLGVPLFLALEDEGVDRLEGLEAGDPDRAALGRRRIGIREMPEARRVLEAAEDAEAVPRSGIVGRGRRERRGRQHAGEEGCRAEFHSGRVFDPVGARRPARRAGAILAATASEVTGRARRRGPTARPGSAPRAPVRGPRRDPRSARG